MNTQQTEECKISEPAFKPGDVVRWTNSYGVPWHGRRILSVEGPDDFGLLYYLEPTDAPWMHVREENLAHEKLSRAELEKLLPHDGSLRRRCETDPAYLDQIMPVIAARAAADFIEKAAPGQLEKLMSSSSWVIRDKATGKVIMETYDPAKVRALNTRKYEAVPILEYLQGLSKAACPSTPQPVA